MRKPTPEREHRAAKSGEGSTVARSIGTGQRQIA